MKTCDCGNRISNNADHCPKCGKRFTTFMTWVGIVFVMIIILLIIVAAQVAASRS